MTPLRTFGWSALLLGLAFTNWVGYAQNSRFRPVLRLEKTKYILGESIRFWVGVEAQTSRAVIPPELRKPCSLQITKPDSGTNVEAVGWPLDGPVDRGWLGGWRLAAEGPGVYKLAFECSGIKTDLVSLTVERNPIVDQIKAEFRFETLGKVQAETPVPIVLSVSNDSHFTVRFPRPGEMMEGISLRIVRKQPAYSNAFFYPWNKLSHSGLAFDSFTWDAAAKIPSVVLQPGQHFELPLLLQNAYRFDAPGRYEVTFSMVIMVLVGEPNGAFKDVSPIRIVATNTREFLVSPF